LCDHKQRLADNQATDDDTSSHIAYEFELIELMELAVTQVGQLRTRTKKGFGEM